MISGLANLRILCRQILLHCLIDDIWRHDLNELWRDSLDERAHGRQHARRIFLHVIIALLYALLNLKRHS